MKGKVKYINEVLPTGSWKDRRCFIICGGPSLENFNFDQLNGELVLGVNKAFEVSPTINYAMDMKFHDYLYSPPADDKEGKRLSEAWKNYGGIKVFLQLAPKIPFKSDIVVVKRINAKCVSQDLNKGIYAGSNSGFGALMIAIALGANPIYLLGLDLKVRKSHDGKAENAKTHWHKGYPRQSVGVLLRKLKRYKILFEEFASTIEGIGVKVVNLGPDSELKCFPDGKLSDVLNG
jgi:hypothetical protein